MSPQSTAPATVHLELAPAKLTVSLRVTGVRPDGYHLIDAEMVTIDLVDALAFRDSDVIDLRVSLDKSAAAGLPVSAGPDNLVARALTAVGRTAHVDVIKRIPAGGGLGGGSSNAAAVYRWAGLTSEADIAAASALGADVAFCVRGGRARVTGIGEILEPLPFEARSFTLIVPPFGVSTPAVYKAWDELGGPTDPSGGNDLEAAALVVEPRLAEWRDRLATLTGQRPRLAGSGSTWFVEGAYPGPGVLVAHTRHAH